MSDDIDKPFVSDMIHYSMERGPGSGQPRPAVVVAISVADPLVVSLQVFTNGGQDHMDNIVWRQNIPYDPDGKPGTWRWPPEMP